MRRGWETGSANSKFHISFFFFHAFFLAGKPSDFKMTPMRGHKSFVSCLKMYRNNLVSGSNDNTVRVWNVRSKDALRTLEGHSACVNSVEFSEMRIASSSEDGTARLWDTSNGHSLHVLSHNGPVKQAKFDNEMIYTASSDRSVKLWDSRNNNSLSHSLPHTSEVSDVHTFQHLLVSRSADSTKVWDVRNPAHSLHNLPASTSLHLVNTEKLAAGFSNGNVRLYNTSSGQLTRSMSSSHARAVNSLQCDGEFVVSCSSDCTAKEQRCSDGVLVHTYQDPQTPSPINHVQFDERKIVTAAQDNTIKVWKRETGTRQV